MLAGGLSSVYLFVLMHACVCVYVCACVYVHACMCGYIDVHALLRKLCVPLDSIVDEWDHPLVVRESRRVLVLQIHQPWQGGSENIGVQDADLEALHRCKQVIPTMWGTPQCGHRRLTGPQYDAATAAGRLCIPSSPPACLGPNSRRWWIFRLRP